MEIGTIGYNYRHREKFIMDRPDGTGCRLMLLIKEPSVFVINGEEQDVRKNSFVMFSPSTAYKYYAKEEVYADDWIYFNFEDGDEEKFQSLGIPSDKIVHLGNMEELSQLVHFISYEHYSEEEGHEKIEKHYTEIFLIKLSRLIKNSGSHSRIVTDRVSRFTQLRSKIYTLPEEITDVGSMAAAMGMSRSGFQHSYKKIFGVSVMSDIISGKMKRAQQLLVSTNLTVKDIAQKIGYANEYNFMRQFKTYCGKTPTEYRNQI